jgi:nitrogen regulatory protein PII
VEFILDRLEISGYTWLDNVKGRGSETGEPRKGTHTRPEMNSAALVVIPDEKVESLLESVQKLDKVNKVVGVRAFVWEILQAV